MVNSEIVLLHGALGASDQLIPLSQSLQSKGFKVFSHSFSGHGKTPFRDNFNISQFSNELKDLILENKLVRPNVFGYSMGGFVALKLAKTEPALIGKIITLGTKFKWTKEIAEKEIQNLNPEVIEQKVPKFAQTLETRHGAGWKELLKKTATMMIEMGNKNPLLLEDFKTITNNVKLGLGEFDQMVSLEETVEVQALLGNSNLYRISGAKHPIETVDPDVLTGIISEFLA